MGELARQPLTLDLETIMSINAELGHLDFDVSKPLDSIHGALTVKIVKGRFQLIEVCKSTLLVDRTKHAIA